MSFPFTVSRSSLALSLPCALAIAQGPTLDYAPVGPEVVLNTDFTQLQPTQGPPVNVAGGVFVFRNVTINPGVRVRSIGSRPMIWIVHGSFIVHGELTVSGNDGERVMTLASANFPSAGGVGGAGGGAGGNGSPNSVMRSVSGAAGSAPPNLPGAGGGGGNLACVAGTGRGSGGGGGSFATQGDPWYGAAAGPGTLFQQRQGIGGQGGLGAAGAATRTLNGGTAGVSPFTDARSDNDFFGIAVDVATRRSIVGELALPIGGQGGGGGGNLSHNSSCNLNDVNFSLDPKGGGGGGGGGCLIVYSRNFIYVGPSGQITANGGHGGGGEQAGSCDQGGGGGAGAGGMIILAAEQAIALTVKGETYANRDYDFVLSADGGICRTGLFGTPIVNAKYPANSQVPQPGTSYDSAPLGGLGGMGVIQLFTRPGTNADGTNTVLDDGIILVQGSQLLFGAQKRRYLAWRGFPNQAGVPVDDSGTPTNIGSNEGDIRPTPILMPLF